MKKTENHPWLEMEKGINNKAKLAEEKWGFSCLRKSTELVYDIGEYVYYALCGAVHKGRIVRVIPSGMCWVTTEEKNTLLCVNMKEIYKNVRYALMRADYQVKQRQSESTDFKVES